MTTPADGRADPVPDVVARAHEVALCLDFDGTLAAIVDDPDQARPLPGVVPLLGTLAGRFAAVALVSGRPAGYLADHAAAPGVRCLGMYGLEEIRDGHLWVDPRLAAGRAAVTAAREQLFESLPVRRSGATLEDKEFAVVIHTRRIVDPDRWAQPIKQLAHEVAESHGLKAFSGKRVWELRPAVPSDKGDAVRRVVADSGAGTVLVAGDDLADLAAFSAAAAISRNGHRSVRVAVRSPEAPLDLLSQADVVVDGPSGLRELLQRLVR